LSVLGKEKLRSTERYAEEGVTIVEINWGGKKSGKGGSSFLDVS